MKKFCLANISYLLIIEDSLLPPSQTIPSNDKLTWIDMFYAWSKLINFLLPFRDSFLPCTFGFILPVSEYNKNNT